MEYCQGKLIWATGFRVSAVPHVHICGCPSAHIRTSSPLFHLQSPLGPKGAYSRHDLSTGRLGRETSTFTRSGLRAVWVGNSDILGYGTWLKRGVQALGAYDLLVKQMSPRGRGIQKEREKIAYSWNRSCHWGSIIYYWANLMSPYQIFSWTACFYPHSCILTSDFSFAGTSWSKRLTKACYIYKPGCGIPAPDRHYLRSLPGY